MGATLHFREGEAIQANAQGILEADIVASLHGASYAQADSVLLSSGSLNDRRSGTAIRSRSRGGRVLDPETGLDAVRNVGIRDGKIARVSSAALSGGRVVSPGFIDLHQHGQDMASQRVKALDGVTTALELEIGAPDVAQFLKAKEGHSLIHYGISASHSGEGSGVRRTVARRNHPAQERRSD